MNHGVISFPFQHLHRLPLTQEGKVVSFNSYAYLSEEGLLSPLECIDSNEPVQEETAFPFSPVPLTPIQRLSLSNLQQSFMKLPSSKRSNFFKASFNRSSSYAHMQLRLRDQSHDSLHEMGDSLMWSLVSPDMRARSFIPDEDEDLDGVHMHRDGMMEHVAEDWNTFKEDSSFMKVRQNAWNCWTG